MFERNNENIVDIFREIILLFIMFRGTLHMCAVSIHHINNFYVYRVFSIRFMYSLQKLLQILLSLYHVWFAFDDIDYIVVDVVVLCENSTCRLLRAQVSRSLLENQKHNGTLCCRFTYCLGTLPTLLCLAAYLTCTLRFHCYRYQLVLRYDLSKMSVYWIIST